MVVTFSAQGAVLQEMGANLEPTAIVDLAQDLLATLDEWSPYAVDWLFYQAFFNQRLQGDLRAVRQRLFRSPDPPEPRHLADVLKEVDLSEDLISSADWTLEVVGSEKWFRGPLWTIQERHSHEDVTDIAAIRSMAWLSRVPALARAVAELADRHFSEPLAMHAALIYGIPPWPLRLEVEILPLPLKPGGDPGAVLASMVQMDVDGQTVYAIAGLVLRIYTAKLLVEKHRHVVVDAYAREVAQYGLELRNWSPSLPEVVALWSEEGPLPHLEIIVVIWENRVPRASHIERVLKQEGKGKPFYDRGTHSTQDMVRAIRKWTTATLVLRAGMGNREAMRAWNEEHPDLSYGLDEEYKMLMTSDDVHLREGIRETEEKAARMAERMATHWRTSR
jgi:hypothetical protein